jgi:hypothetical protein
MSGPCTPWVTLGEVQALPDATGLDDAVLVEMIDVASEVLYVLSARQYPGVCVDEVLPLRRWYNVESNFAFPPSFATWRNWWGVHSCGRPPERAGGCGPLSELTLGAYPLRSIVEVKIDGEVIDPATYRIDDHRWLVRVDQTGIGFPCCQALDRDPETEVGTFRVQFEWGQAPPRSGVIAASVLAIELAKSVSGNPCNLPQRVLNLQTQGVSYTLLDPLTFLDNGQTGLYLVDLFLAAANPKKLRRRPSVISPDFRRPVRRTNTTPGS